MLGGLSGVVGFSSAGVAGAGGIPPAAGGDGVTPGEVIDGLGGVFSPGEKGGVLGGVAAEGLLGVCPG